MCGNKLESFWRSNKLRNFPKPDDCAIVYRLKIPQIYYNFFAILKSGKISMEKSIIDDDDMFLLQLQLEFIFKLCHVLLKD